MTNTILRIDASARHTGSVSRDLTDRIVARFAGANVVTRDLATPLPLLDEVWIGANFTPPEDRTTAQQVALSLSDTLIAELRAADTIVIGLPIYNFSVPAAFKAWVDLVSRVGETFHYTDTGPKGLLSGKKAIIAYAAGGVAIGSDYDFASGYMRQILGFLGITDVTTVAADQVAVDAQASIQSAKLAVDTLNLAA